MKAIDRGLYWIPLGLALSASCSADPVRPTDGNEPEPPAGGGTWSQVAALPEAVANAAVAAFEGRIWVMGGSTSSTTLSARVQRYDPETNRWERLPDLPQPLATHGAAVLDGQLLIGGGSIAPPAEPGIPNPQVWAWDPGSSTWKVHSALPVSDVRTPMVATPAGILAGIGESAALLAPRSTEWLVISPPPFEPYLLAADGADIWAAGRVTAFRLASFDPESARWQGVVEFGGTTNITAMWMFGERLHMMITEGQSLARFVRRNSDGTETLLSLPEAAAWSRSGMSVTLAGKLYFIAGQAQAPSTAFAPYIARVDVFTPEP